MIVVQPEKLVFPFIVKKIACGWGHSLFLSGLYFCKIYDEIFILEEGLCFGKGKNINGEIPLGKAEKAFYKEPTLIPIEPNNEPIIDIFCGFRQSFFISKSNGIWCSGYNKFSELGFENESDSFCYFSLKLNGLFQNTNIKIIKMETGQKFTALLDSKKKMFLLFKLFEERFGKPLRLGWQQIWPIEQQRKISETPNHIQASGRFFFRMASHINFNEYHFSIKKKK